MPAKKLQCSINQVGCKGAARYVCHHCGTPLCDGPNCCKWGWDGAFAGWPVAYHCPVCDHLPPLGRGIRNIINESNELYAGYLAAKKWIQKNIFERT